MSPRLLPRSIEDKNAPDHNAILQRTRCHQVSWAECTSVRLPGAASSESSVNAISLRQRFCRSLSYRDYFTRCNRQVIL